jgi:transcriptional regulator with XRE-family HTH domain
MADLRREIGRKVRLLREARLASQRRQEGRQRRVAKLSQEELAERADLTPDYISKLERGRYSPSAEVIASLAKALGVTPGELFPRRGARENEARARALDELVAVATQLAVADIDLVRDLAKVVLKKQS